MRIIEGFIIIYFIVALNFLFNKLKDFSCNVQGIWNNHMSFRHILNIIAVFFLLVLFTRSTPIAPYRLVIVTFLMYIFFILITRCEFTFLMIFLACMISVFYLEADKVYKLSLNPPNKEEIKKNIEKIQLIIQISSLIIVFIGVIVYIGQHVREFGDEWDWKLFWFGVTKCAGDGVPMPVKKSLLNNTGLGIKKIFNIKTKPVLNTRPL